MAIRNLTLNTYDRCVMKPYNTVGGINGSSETLMTTTRRYNPDDRSQIFLQLLVTFTLHVNNKTNS